MTLRLRGGHVDEANEVGGVPCGGQDTPAITSLVDGASIVGSVHELSLPQRFEPHNGGQREEDLGQ